jgi:hypothetical protein
MSELPRTDDLPRAEEGYDPLRVEEAFASFGDRVRELESIAAELRAELRSLRAERAAAFAAPETDPDWPAEHGVGDGGLGGSPDWVAAAVPPPLQRPVAVPRLALEAVFLLLVALFAGLADLAPEWIALVMAGAWVVVALVEWTAAARRARWHLDEIPPPLELADATGDTTGRWSSPVVEATAFAAPDVSESRTVVTKLPVDPEVAEAVETDPEDTAETAEPEEEPEKPPRRGFFRRRGSAEAPAPADPWEA